MIKFLWIEKGPTPGFIGKERTKMFKRVWAAVGKHWHRRMRPKHFTAAGAKEYGYPKRTVKYMKRKLKVKGHNLPLVYSGTSRFATRFQDIRPRTGGVRIVMNAPALNLRPKGSDRWNMSMAEQLRKISSREAKVLARVFAKNLDAELSGIQSRKSERL